MCLRAGCGILPSRNEKKCSKLAGWVLDFLRKQGWSVSVGNSGVFGYTIVDLYALMGRQEQVKCFGHAQHSPQCTAGLLPLELLEVKIHPIRLFQHAMVIDSRNSSILPRRGALLKVNQVVFSLEPLVEQPVMCGTGLSHTVLGLVSTGSSIECLKSSAVSCPEGTGELGDTLEAKVIQLVSSCCSWYRQDPGCPVYIFRAAPSGEVCR